jgi:hypothetical protein
MTDPILPILHPEIENRFAALSDRLDKEREERKKWHEERLRNTAIFGVIGIIIALMKKPRR